MRFTNFYQPVLPGMPVNYLASDPLKSLNTCFGKQGDERVVSTAGKSYYGWYGRSCR